MNEDTLALPTPNDSQPSYLEREQRKVFADLLMEEMGQAQLVKAMARWEIVCGERGWNENPRNKGKAPSRQDRLIDRVLARATAAAAAMPDEPLDEEAGEDEDLR